MTRLPTHARSQKIVADRDRYVGIVAVWMLAWVGSLQAGTVTILLVTSREQASHINDLAYDDTGLALFQFLMAVVSLVAATAIAPLAVYGLLRAMEDRIAGSTALCSFAVLVALSPAGLVAARLLGLSISGNRGSSDDRPSLVVFSFAVLVLPPLAGRLAALWRLERRHLVGSRRVSTKLESVI